MAMKSGDPYPATERDRLKSINNMWTYPAKLDTTMKPFAHGPKPAMAQMKPGELKPVADTRVIGADYIGDSVSIPANEAADNWPDKNRQRTAAQNSMWTYHAQHPK